VIRIFTGYDKREALGWQVFCRSLIEQSSQQVSITPIGGQQWDGTNAFTYSRFLVPRMCKYDGWALFVDGADMLCRADIAELWALRDPRYAVQVVKHDYKTKHPRKYLSTPMEANNEDYPRKNWSSVVLFNCGHPRNHFLTGDILTDKPCPPSMLHRFSWLSDDMIGELPPEWNVLIGEQETDAKIAHFTLGIPSFYDYRNSRYADEWRGWLL
jgi:hypothetical protein